MKSERKVEILIGVLFLTATVTFMIGDGGMIGPIVDDADYLDEVDENKTLLITGVLIAFIDVIAILGIAVLFYPILKKYDEHAALGYLGVRIAEFAILILYLLVPLLLIDISQEYVEAGIQADSNLLDFGTLLLALRYWTWMFILIINGLATLMLSYALYHSKLVPRSLSVLGLIGGIVLLSGTALDMLGHIDVDSGVGMISVLPGGLFELFLPIWLFVKGFNLSVTD
ncbi:MAG: DUF4386 domain-containing protein [Candidatus Kariarchaeaceae archaeon]|jgi:hypothetical protein